MQSIQGTIRLTPGTCGSDETFDTRYTAWASRSPELFEQASEVIPGGAGSSARTAKFGWAPYPPFMTHGTGSRIYDADGHEYVDYLLGLGPMPYPLEIEAARKVVDAVPGVDMVRFTNSGSEAVGSAVRIARAYTGRRLIIRFEGHYHGWQDTVYWSNHVDPAVAGPASRPRAVPSGPGVPAELEGTMLVLTWNDPESFAAVMAERGDEVAAVITEPAVFNTGCILPEPGYLELLREQTRKHGALLIFDEVITGFRFARGGAQEYFGVTPDLTTLAKGVGGGFPVAAIGGSREVMSMIADGRYSHSGTYNANVIACAAVCATMDVLAEPGLFERQRRLGETLMSGLRRLAADAGLPVIIEGLGTVFQLWFSEHPIRNWRDAARYADESLFTRWWQEMLLRGVLFHPSQYENLFLSLVHNDDDVGFMLDAAEQAFAVISR